MQGPDLWSPELGSCFQEQGCHPPCCTGLGLQLGHKTVMQLMHSLLVSSSLLPRAFLVPLCAAKRLRVGATVVWSWWDLDRFPHHSPPAPVSSLVAAGGFLSTLAGWLSSFLISLSTSCPKCLDCFCSWELRLGPSREPLGLFKGTPRKELLLAGPSWAPQSQCGSHLPQAGLLCGSLRLPHSKAFCVQITVWLLRDGCQKNTGSLVRFEFQMNNNK